MFGIKNLFKSNKKAVCKLYNKDTNTFAWKCSLKSYLSGVSKEIVYPEDVEE